MDGTKNYWYKYSSDEIESIIYDKKDDSTLGLVEYEPYLNSLIGFSASVIGLPSEGQINLGEKITLSVLNSEKGLWILTNAEKKPLKEAILDDIKAEDSTSLLNFASPEIEESGKIKVRYLSLGPQITLETHLINVV